MPACGRGEREPIAQLAAVIVDSSGNVTCVPDIVKVKQSDALVKFVLIGSNYRFADQNAIVVSNPGSDFPIPSWTLGSSIAVLLDKHLTMTDFKYTVNLVNTITNEPLVYDPQIRNDT